MRKIVGWIVLAAVLSLSSPALAQRKAGLTVYAIARQTAQTRKDPMWGFVGSHEALMGQKDRPRFLEPQEVLDYFYKLPAAAREAGVWLIFANPMSDYSPQEKMKIEKFKRMVAERNIPLTLCGGHRFLDWRLVEGLDPWVAP